MYCSKCGTQNPENAKVCLSCSQPLPLLSDAPQPGTKTSVLAIWSFVLAIIGLFTFMLTALPALICGIIGLVKISKSKGQLRGTGLAVTGIVIPIIFAIFLPIFMVMLAIMIPAISTGRQVAQQMICAENLSIIGKAIVTYTSKHNDIYPPADSWCDVLIRDCNVSPKRFCCPTDGKVAGRSSYAFNINLSGKKTSQAPPDVVLLYETNLAVNPTGGPEILSTQKHHVLLFSTDTTSTVNPANEPKIHSAQAPDRIGCNVLFANSRVKFVKTKELSTLRWTLE